MKSLRIACAALLLACSHAHAADDLTADAAARFVQLALDCVHREYPNKIAHVLHSDADAKPPRVLTPAFYGCYDWHSSVHGHWLLARAARRFPDAPFAQKAKAALARSLTDTFAGISPLNGPMFMAAQVAGISPRWSRWVGSGHPNRISKNVEITIDTLIQRLRLFS